ncbi:MAG TPA: glycerophosphodiester phosphodiesterase [Terriglobales bacterium]|jgi:glycerophosphoryl diester phosphodiesterase|nr:glycerophosphodiester phosphodiesterase [Terriglobales bacterium]
MPTTTTRPLLLGHRGVRPLPYLGLRWRKSDFPLENTLAAFDYALAHGCDGFEFDVRYTHDRRSVLWHDPTFERNEVSTLVYEGMERRSGCKIPCLEHVLSRYASTAYLDIELKAPGNEEAVVEALHADAPRRGYVVSSFLPEVLLRLYDLDPRVPLGYICDQQKKLAVWTDLPITTFFPHHRVVSSALIDEAHARGLKVMTWTVNDREDMLRLAEWGVDGLISDSPTLLSEAFPTTALSKAAAQS